MPEKFWRIRYLKWMARMDQLRRQHHQKLRKERDGTWVGIRANSGLVFIQILICFF
jgi:hypothetical protein